ncbi:MAG: Phage holin family Hol44, in holin superfamily [Clostridia bacterium]|nr:Phage holin family Hol44, in holin superfamily [Clostridia bacterium]
MDMEILLQFVKPELLILVAFLWCLGLFLKKAPWFKSEWMIPFILLLIGIIFAVIYSAIVLGEGFTIAGLIIGIIQGVIIAALTVFFNESVKQVLVKRQDDNPKRE